MANLEKAAKDSKRITEKSISNTKRKVEEAKGDVMKSVKKVKLKTKFNLEEHVKDINGYADRRLEAAKVRTEELADKAKDVTENTDEDKKNK